MGAKGEGNALYNVCTPQETNAVPQSNCSAAGANHLQWINGCLSCNEGRKAANDSSIIRGEVI